VEAMEFLQVVGWDDEGAVGKLSKEEVFEVYIAYVSIRQHTSAYVSIHQHT
jgi:hypothetical protein